MNSRLRILLLGVLLACLALLAACDSGQRTDTGAWQQLPPTGAHPSPRLASCAVYDSDNHQVLLFGGDFVGNAPDVYLEDLWSYDPVGNKWKELTPSGSGPVEREEALGVYNARTKRFLMFGGSNWTVMSDLWAYDPASNNWTELHPAGAAPPALVGAKIACDPRSGRVFLFGGSYDDGSGDLGANMSGDLFIYDPVANLWTKADVQGEKPAGRYPLGLVYDSDADVLLAFGGSAYQPFKVYHDAWAFDPQKSRWKQLHASGQDLPSPFGETVYDPGLRRTLVYAWGGTAEGLQAALISYDLEADSWGPAAPGAASPPPRAVPSLVYCPDVGGVLLIGGADLASSDGTGMVAQNGGRYFEDVWVFRVE